MDQSASPQHTFELPSQKPTGNEAAGQPMAGEALPVANQEHLGNPGNVPSASPMQPIMPPVSMPLPGGGQPLQPPMPQPAAGAHDLTAGDSDLIEKEWVIKAKAIVESTSHDPYVQNKEINKFKAHYLKKRYNKDMPVNDR